MRTSLALITLATLVLTSPVDAQHGSHGVSAPSRQRVDPRPAETVYQPQASAGRIALTLAPRWTDGRLLVLVMAQADSGDLSQVNLQQAVRLVVNGAARAPASADSLEGRRARARIVFPLEKAPEHFTIEIRGVPDVEVRVLQWPVQHPSGD